MNKKQFNLFRKGEKWNPETGGEAEIINPQFINHAVYPVLFGTTSDACQSN